jgi:phosphatidylglycerol lysyltransferase
MRSLREDKQKFDPVWEPRYLVYPGGAPLGSLLTDVTALVESPHIKRG